MSQYSAAQARARLERAVRDGDSPSNIFVEEALRKLPEDERASFSGRLLEAESKRQSTATATIHGRLQESGTSSGTQQRSNAYRKIFCGQDSPRRLREERLESAYQKTFGRTADGE